MNKDLYTHLKEVARNKETTSYSEIGPIVGITDFSDPYNRRRISEILGEISEYEHGCGRPMLSAVVILKGGSKPGAGFFTLARDLGLLTGTVGERAKLDFFDKELKKVHEFWS